MARITIQPKPGLWAANAAAVDPYWREYWQDLFIFIPYHGEPGNAVAPAEKMASFGMNAMPELDRDPTPDQMPPYWQDATDQADWVLGPVGPGLKGSTLIGTSEGLIVTTNGKQFRVNGRDKPMAVAILFEYDGLDLGDQRALISHGSFRLRVQTDGDPHGIGASSTAIANCVWDNELTLVVVWSNEDNTDSSDYDIACFNLDEHPDVREFAFEQALLGEAGNDSELRVATQNSNDPSEGITVYGFWAWGNRHEPGPESEGQWWTPEKAEKFAEDPFGMYRRHSAPEIVLPFGELVQGKGEQSGPSTPVAAITVTLDQTPVEGNLLVYGVAGRGSSFGFDTPSGWNEVLDDTHGAHASAIGWKIAGASESKALTVDRASAHSNEMSLVVSEYKGPFVTSALDQSASDESGGASVSVMSTGTTGTTSQADELAVGVADAVGDLKQWKEPTQDFRVDRLAWNADDASQVSAMMGSKLLTATQTVETTFAWTDAERAAARILTFKKGGLATPSLVIRPNQYGAKLAM